MFMAAGRRILNLGCGSRFNPGHTNMDFISTHPFVRAWDLTEGVPFDDATFDLVYHSHVLEHFSAEAGQCFLRECARVLKPTGIIRVAVPDLETIARTYLATLADRLNDSPSGVANHTWMLLELYDQTVRTQPGGAMKQFLFAPELPNRDFIQQRVGSDALKISAAAKLGPRSFFHKLEALRRSGGGKRLYQKLAAGVVGGVAGLLLGRRGRRSFEQGWFRTGGEIHQTMYDYLALERALRQGGFEGIVRRDHQTSYCAEWSGFFLDNEPNGSAYKPDSLYAEGLKP